MVNATTAWEGPYYLAQRLGHLDVDRIARMRPADLTIYVGNFRGARALHRFVGKTSEYLVRASERIVTDYGGTAANIWPAWSSAKTVLQRLLEFDGIGHKLANMATRLLVTYYGVPLTGWDEIDVAVDRHVARVFLRTGLVSGTPGKKRHSVAELRNDVIAVARLLRPAFPGALDEPAFFTGANWCTAGHAWCTDGARPCPLASACRKDRRDWEIDS